jgi:hypothetical protein
MIENLFLGLASGVEKSITEFIEIGRMKKQLAAVLVCLVCCGFPAIAEDNDDLESWTGIQADYRASDTWEFSLEHQFRSKSNMSKFGNYLSEMTVTFDPEPFDLMNPLEFKGGIRYYLSNDDKGKIQGIEDHIRFNLDACYDIEFGRFFTDYRIRYQRKHEIGVDDRHVWDWRYRLKIGYNFKNWKLDPELSYEAFFRDEEDAPKGYVKYRVFLETEFNTFKNQEIAVFVGYEESVKGEYGRMLIVGMNYNFELLNIAEAEENE